MTFAPIIVQTTPQVSVKSDYSTPTYNQILNSLGNQVYIVDSFYIYSTNNNQINGVIKYSRYDATGNQEITNITTSKDPYQDANSLIVELEKYPIGVILNGNSTITTTILPNAYLQIKLYCRRITNAFGFNGYNFKMLEEIFKPKFFEDYEGYDADGKVIILEQSVKPLEKASVTEVLNNNENTSLGVLSLAFFTIGLFILVRNEQ